MRRTIYTAFAVLGMAALAWGARRPGYDYEVRCEVQTATAELGDLIWSQGSTPLVCAVPTKRGEYIGADPETTVKMMIAESATSRLWAVVTNQATNATGYLIQWPTIGTNTAASAPWYYTVYFEREGHRYWTGSGSLWIEATTATEDGLEWIEIISGGAVEIATNALAIAEAAAAGVAENAAGVAANAAEIAEVELELDAAATALGRRIDGLWGEMAGGWHYPDYFEVAGVYAGTSEGETTWETSATNTVNNIREASGERRVYKGWKIDARVVRQRDWSEQIAWGDDGGGAGIPLLFTNNLVLFPETLDWEWLDTFDDQAMAGACNRFVTGRLGDFSAETAIEWDARQRGTHSLWYRFDGPAPGSLLAAGWGTTLAAALNGWAATPRKSVHLRTWPEGYGSRTNWFPAGWNTNFWAWNLGDWSCISYFTDWWNVYKPITMVTPRHGICARHFMPNVGTNVYFVGRSGAIYTNQIVAYTTPRGDDLAVVRLADPLPTNDVGRAKLLGAGWKGYCYGSTNSTQGLFGFPVVTFDVAERGYLSDWHPTPLLVGQSSYAKEDENFMVGGKAHGEIPYYRKEAVAGDSGSPVFWPIDGTNVVLLGCWKSPGGGPLPTKMEVDAVIDAWGDDDRCDEVDLGDGGWTNPDIPTPPGQ